MKNLGAVILFIFISLSVKAQIKSFSLTQQDYLKELENFMKANNNEEGKNAFDAFNNQVKAGNITADQLAPLIDLSNLMLDKKLRPVPAFTALLNAVTAFVSSGQLPERYDEWMKISTDILQNYKTTSFVDFLKFSGPFFGKNALYASESKTWSYNAFDYAMQLKDGIPEIYFPAVNLMGSTTGDRMTINETQGTYYPLDNLWVGKKGSVNWFRAQLDSNNVYATLKNYKINTDKNEYRIDSVTFYYIGYLPKPLLGTFTDKLSINLNPNEINYPQFKSYDAAIKITDIIDKVDYFGSFFLKGSVVIGAGQDSSEAQLKFRDDLGRYVLTAQSKSFLIKPEAIFSQHAEIMLHTGRDTIYHPDANLNYNAEKRTVTITRGEIGAAGSAFYSSYHKIDMDVDQIVWGLNDTSLSMRNISGAGQKRSYFESEDLFSQTLYNDVKGISPASPLVMIKRYCEKADTNVVAASILAREINPSLTVDGVRTLFYDMMKKGFIYYDAETQLVTVKDKLFNYVNEYIGKRDYDIIQIMSQSTGANAELDLRKYDLHLNGVNQLYLSDSQFVLVYPDSNSLVVKKNRDMTFTGRIVGGNADFIGKAFYFSYDTFDIKMNNVDSMILYVESTQVDQMGNVLYLPVKTSFSVLQGKLQIDRADNKSSRKNYPEYPIFISYSSSKADYEKKEVYNKVYKKDDFYFKVDPFTIEKLDAIDYSKVKFPGSMVSAGIFPDFKEQLSLQDDRSLGFKTVTPESGLNMYGGKGIYYDSIYLSNEGFKGSGRIDFMASTSTSKKFLFFPDSTLAKVDDFTVTKTEKGMQFPAVKNTNVTMDWEPKDDAMTLTQGETPFDFFDGYTKLKGKVIVSSTGLKGNGTMEWLDVALTSNQFKFGAVIMKADTASMSINSFDPGKLALKLNNVNADVDFDKKTGHFKSNIDTVMTEMPYNQYATTINEFNWDMEAKILDFESTNKKYGDFISTNKTQEGLNFQGTNGKFDMKNYVLGVEGVPFITVADSHITPDSGKVFIEADAKMRTLRNASVIGDTLFTYHTIKNATLDIYGKNSLKGKGNYEYSIPKKQTENISLEEIGVKKVKDSIQGIDNYQLYAKGYVSDSDAFVLEDKVKFKGPVEMNTPDQFLRFKGYAKLDVKDTAIGTSWFHIDDLIDPANPVFSLDNAKTEGSDSAFAGIFKDYDSTNLYVRVMGKRMHKNDPMIFVARGKGFYDEQNDKFYFGNLDKTFDASQPGGLLTYDNKTGNVFGEGPVNFGLKTDIVEIKSYGSIQKDSKDSVFRTIATIALKIPVGDDILNSIGEFIYNANAESAPVDYSNAPLLIDAIPEIGDEKQSKKLMEDINNAGYLEKPKDSPFTFLLSGVEMYWDKNTKSFHSTNSKGQLIWIGSRQINQEIKTYAEFGKKTSGDYFTVYFETPSEDWLYITYRKGQMKILTSNEGINKTIFEADAKKRTIEEDGKSMVYMLESKPQVGKFVRRIQTYTGENSSPVDDAGGDDQ